MALPNTLTGIFKRLKRPSMSVAVPNTRQNTSEAKPVIGGSTLTGRACMSKPRPPPPFLWRLHRNPDLSLTIQGESEDFAEPSTPEIHLGIYEILIVKAAEGKR